MKHDPPHQQWHEEFDHRHKGSPAEDSYLRDSRSPIQVLVDDAVGRGDLRLAASLQALHRKGRK